MQTELTRAAVVDLITKLIQTLSVVIGVVISVLSFNQAREREAAARIAEAQKRKAEAARPFLEMRQKLYLEAAHTAAMMANLKDQVQSWIMQPDGAYVRQTQSKTPFSAHDYFMNNPSLSGRGKALRNIPIPPLSLDQDERQV